MNLSQPDQPKDEVKIALHPDIFPSRDIRAAAEGIASRATHNLRQALVTAGANSNSLSAQSVCRICIATAAEVNAVVFTAKQLGELCGSVGNSFGVSPRTGSWESFALAAVAHYKKHTKTTHQDVTVPTGTKDVPNIEMIDDDTPLDVHDYGDDLSSISPETISGATPALPGSEEKLLIIKARIAARAPLWVKGDRLG